MGIQRVPNLLRWTVLACCLPYPGDPKSAIDCFFLFGISLHPGVTGSAPHWKFRGCRVHSFPGPQELLRPASWLALLSRTFTFELARRGRPQSASNMTTWINSQFPRPDFHRRVQRHYGLQDTGFPPHRISPHDLFSYRLDVLVHPEEVRRVVLLLELHQPIVRPTVGERDAVGLVLGEEVDVRAAAGKRL